MTLDRLSKLEERTARLTILIDPRKKAVFERLCAEEDVTPSQVVRKLIRSYIEQRLGLPWNPAEVRLPLQDSGSGGASRPRRSRR
jgi:hypothetical protein